MKPTLRLSLAFLAFIVALIITPQLIIWNLYGFRPIDLLPDLLWISLLAFSFSVAVSEKRRGLKIALFCMAGIEIAFLCIVIWFFVALSHSSFTIN